MYNAVVFSHEIESEVFDLAPLALATFASTSLGSGRRMGAIAGGNKNRQLVGTVSSSFDASLDFFSVRHHGFQRRQFSDTVYIVVSKVLARRETGCLGEKFAGPVIRHLGGKKG